MAVFDKIGIFLKDSPADPAVLSFGTYLAGLGAEEVHYVHVVDEALGAIGAATDPSSFEAAVRAEIPQAVAKRARFELRPGDGATEVLRVAQERELDLVVIGRRLPSSQLAIGSRFARVARKAPCCVLIVPEQCHAHFGRIHVAVDCSEHSKLSLNAAVNLAKASGDPRAQLLAQTVRRVSTQFDLAGVSFKESAETQKRHGDRDLETFLTDLDTQGIPVERLVSLSEDPAAAITHVAVARKMDIVVIGSRGGTRAAAILLGSISERVLISCARPVLIIKKKGETRRLLEALFSLD